MNKKGLTLVEVLTTIVILGIIMTVGIVAVTRVLESARERYYNTLLKTIEVAAESYYNDNRNKLPKVLGQKQQVTIEELVNSKYLDEVKDANDNSCDKLQSKVEVYKASSSQYKYITYLKCSTKYDNTKEALPNNLIIDIALKKDYNDLSDNIKISSIDGIKSYRYRIYKNNTLFYDSAVVDAKGKKETSFALNYKDNVNNGSIIRIVTSATDIYGNTKEKTANITIVNPTAP